MGHSHVGVRENKGQSEGMVAGLPTKSLGHAVSRIWTIPFFPFSSVKRKEKLKCSGVTFL